MNRAVRTAAKRASIYMDDASYLVQQMVYALPPEIDLSDDRAVIEQLFKCQFDQVAIIELVEEVIDVARMVRAEKAADRRDMVGSAFGFVLTGCALYAAAIAMMGHAYAATPDVGATWVETGTSFLTGLGTMAFFFFSLFAVFCMFTAKAED